jgi:outer membrane beta-barrel protein
LGFARLFNHLGIALICILGVGTLSAMAQGLPGSEESAPAVGGSNAGAAASDNDVEALYDKDENKPKPQSEKKPEDRAAIKKAATEVQNLSDLAKLAPFSDIAVIQRRFLPKTGRFELSANAFTNLNNPFFTAYGFEGKVAYYMTEKYAIEGIGDYAATASREVTDDLAKNRNITTSNLVTSKGFFGAALKWNPIYGKITLLNKSIVPFDLNFDAGGGLTMTADGQSVPTLHLGTSQVFAWTKSAAFRWDIAWNYFQANATDENGLQTKVTQSDIYLGIGMSFYFPEASYR